jgi:hypothetical protein
MRLFARLLTKRKKDGMLEYYFSPNFRSRRSLFTLKYIETRALTLTWSSSDMDLIIWFVKCNKTITALHFVQCDVLLFSAP